MAIMTYTGEFKKYRFEAIYTEISEVLGNSAKDIPIDLITTSFINSTEDGLGYGWSLGVNHFEYPDGMALEDVSEQLDYQFKETDLGAFIYEYLSD